MSALAISEAIKTYFKYLSNGNNYIDKNDFINNAGLEGTTSQALALYFPKNKTKLNYIQFLKIMISTFNKQLLDQIQTRNDKNINKFEIIETNIEANNNDVSIEDDIEVDGVNLGGGDNTMTVLNAQLPLVEEEHKDQHVEEVITNSNQLNKLQNNDNQSVKSTATKLTYRRKIKRLINTTVTRATEFSKDHPIITSLIVQQLSHNWPGIINVLGQGIGVGIGAGGTLIDAGINVGSYATSLVPSDTTTTMVLTSLIANRAAHGLSL